MTLDFIEQLEADLAADQRGALHEHLAADHDETLEQLVALRKAKGLTVEHVAAAMNRSVQCVRDFERLGADPALSTVARYAAAIGAKVTTSVDDYDEVET